MEQEKIKVWISKYALTKGVYEEEVRMNNRFPSTCSSIAHWKLYHRGEWHNDKTDAISRAEELRKLKLKSLKSQLEKIENLKFE